MKPQLSGQGRTMAHTRKARTGAFRRSRRGMTMLEVLVSLAILAMISLLIYGAFDSMSRGKKGEAMRAERARQGREALLRMTHELSESFLSLHNPPVLAMLTRATVFVGQNSTPFDRIDFASFAHRRMMRDVHESDQAEIGYFASEDPDVAGKTDLARREQTPIDMDPLRGGVVNVLAENIEAFDIRYLDPLTGTWGESWDSSQTYGQFNRLPLELRISLTIKGLPGNDATISTTKVMMPMLKPLAFGIPQ
jgi:general secretion pathway protein J